ncbi:MAG: NHL repeat-containing protein [Nitrososphaerales archaeon]
MVHRVVCEPRRPYLNGHFQLYNLGNLVTAPVGIAIDSKGILWITQHGPSFISEFNPETHYFRTISTSIPSSPNEGTALPYFIQVDSRDNVWFNEHYGNATARFSPSNNTLIEYENPSRVPSAGNISSALTIALSPYGQPWFTELFTCNIGTVNMHVPIDLSFKEVGNNQSSATVNVTNGSARSLNFSVTTSTIDSSFPVKLTSYIGNYTKNTESFNLPFSPQAGSGNFTSILRVENSNASETGAYFVKVSAETPTIVASDILEVFPGISIPLILIAG